MIAQSETLLTWYEWPDGAAVWRACDEVHWVGRWANGTTITRWENNRLVTWYFESYKEAASYLSSMGQGPFALLGNN
jgi:hypothetical protein